MRCAAVAGRPAAGRRDASASIPTAISAAQEASLSSRRYYDLAYIAIILLAFPLYWIKVIDSRLCGAKDLIESDPWLIRAPSPSWIKSWPCNGSHASKLAYTFSSPAPFLRSLAWPICFSELHFFTSLYAVFFGGFIMLAATRGSKYDMTNKWRLLWALTARVQVRATPILVKMLRPHAPWPVAVSQTLPMDGPAHLLYSVALMGPVTHTAIGAAIDVVYVVIICLMYGSSWPHAMSPLALVMLQAACGLLTVGISVLLAPSPPSTGAVATAADSPKSPKAGLEPYGEPGHHNGGSAGNAHREGFLRAAAQQFAPLTASEPRCVSLDSVPEPQARGSTPADAGVAAAPPVGRSHSRGGQEEEERLLRLCRRLAGASACMTRGSLRSRRASSSVDGDGGSARDAAAVRTSTGTGSDNVDRRSSSSSSAAHAGAVAGRSSSTCGSSSGDGGCVYGTYDSKLAWTRLHVKIPGLEPSDLAPEAESRVADAVAVSYIGTAATGVAVRSGCIELHLDLVGGMARLLTGTSAAAPASAGLAAAAAAQGPGPYHEAAFGGAGGGGGGPHGPASAEQQALASCVLQALGLPPGYDAAVRAQVGAHLLTLTPAADAGGPGAGGGGGGWAVLGTRRLQAHEVPCITRVEPPAVVAAAAAAAADGDVHVAATLRLTISGSEERLAVAHQDGDLEVLALFEGAFLKLSDLQWGPLEGGSAAAAAAAGAWGSFMPSFLPCRRVLTVTLALPAGRTGAVSLLFLRHGTAGPAHSLLLLQPEGAAIAAEVAALQGRLYGAAADADAPSASSVANFVRDLGHWLQYRDFWRRQAAAAAAAAAASGGRGGARSGRLAGRPSASWMGALMFWSRCCSGGGGGGLGRLGILKRRRCMPVQGHHVADAAAHSRGDDGVAAAAHVPHVPWSESDLLDQGGSGSYGGGYSGGEPQARHIPYASAVNGLHAQAMYGGVNGAAAAPAAEQQQQQRRLAQGSLPAFGQRAYQAHMGIARRALLEFALERRCAAVAATLMEPAPVPPPPPPAAAAAAASWQLAELAEASRAASPDGLTLLHRAVRSGDAATLEVVLRAAARATDAAAAAAASVRAQRRDGAGAHHPPIVVDAGAHDASAACGGTGQDLRFRLYDWDTYDAHGLTPLHYLAVLDDGGALARRVLATRPEALALWDVGGPDMPSPASFAAQNAVAIDLEALCRHSESESEPLVREPTDPAPTLGAGAVASKAQETRPLFLAALLGFPCGDVEKRYQRFARARARSGGLPTWLLLHLAACAGGALQALAQPHACCRRGTLPLLVLQAGSFLLALICYRPVGQGRAGACRIAAWALQALTLAVLLAKSISPLPRPWTLGGTIGPFTGAGPSGGSSGGAVSSSSSSPECGSAALHHGLLALHHALAVATVPYTMPYALHKVLAVQVVEVAACALLLLLLRAGFAAPGAARMAGLGPAGGGGGGGLALGGVCHSGPHVFGEQAGGLGLVWASGAAAHVVRGSLLRSAMSSVVMLAADLRARAAFVCSCCCCKEAPQAQAAQQPQQPQQQQQLQQRHEKLD
ncbi:hypothetical protein PLESTB_000223600 [Pleodorina starrii]|uniref:Uncharacterized protein n=1 Tax=Pleodorina starrii TaxID=330485 RepID=A0A9W6BCX2_9CHLO|nr:hypothetical protein PLESTM_001549700 [Pleodorina starrii]GLC49480.1 hypothetical protein PLESTB_000223600 [Pleodorina starrii]GLC75719.1 hypothetical protein PLESTF_001677200 [Pleodorina starrii]